MEVRRCLQFQKCFCCAKNFNVELLIEMTTNSVIFGEEQIDFADLLLDVCLISIDPSKTSYICDDCKNKLVDFHLFKRQIKNYSTFQTRNLVVLAKVDDLLTNHIDSSLELQVKNEHEVITISRHFEPIVEEVQVAICESPTGEFIEEYIYPEIPSVLTEETQSLVEDPSDMEERILIEETASKAKRRNTKKYKYPINTNDKLTDEQKNWINQQARECEVTRDGQIAYKCSMCETVLRIPGSLKKHLRDTHILKPKKTQIVESNRKELKDEIQQSKLVVETSDGPEVIWRCQRCDSNRIFRSESGLKVHIRYSHIRSQRIDAKFISQFRVEFNDGNVTKEGWKCPECKKVLRSRDGMRNHIKFEHPNLANAWSNDSPEACKLESSSHNDSNDYEALQTLLERKRRTLKNEVNGNVCKDCGIQFINGTSKKEKSYKIHLDCHKILNVVSQYYQFPKCETTKTVFVNNDDLEKFFQSDQRLFRPLPYEGMTSKVSEKFKDAIGTASIDDSDAWTCGHCGVKYRTEFECNTHVMILHSRKLICPVDHMEFEGNRGISQFNIHMSNKHPEMFPDLVISCTYCKMNFESVFEKLAHMKTCIEKKFECDHCARKYFTKTELIRHLKIVSGEISYVCEVCSKACASTMDLKLHRTSHTNERLYVCSYPECKKSFKTPAARSSHMETHGNVGYSCSHCSSSFRQRALLQRHLRKGLCRGSPKLSSKNFIVVEQIFDDDGQMFEVSEESQI